MAILALSFNNVDLTPIDNNDGQIWFTSKQLAEALGYADDRGVSRIYNKYDDEFTDSMTEVVESATSIDAKGLVTKTRIFSLRGCHLVAMFSRTKVAKDFRVWVLDLLDEHIAKTNVPLDVIQSLNAVFAIRAIEFDKASGHGYGLNKWKGDKTVIDDAITTIMEYVQPELTNLETLQVAK
jgi:prophage antirepressor-like protein